MGCFKRAILHTIQALEAGGQAGDISSADIAVGATKSMVRVVRIDTRCRFTLKRCLYLQCKQSAVVLNSGYRSV